MLESTMLESTMLESTMLESTMLEITNPEAVFCAECLYKTCQADEYPCNKCAVDSNGMDATEYSPAGTPDEPAGTPEEE